MPTAFDAQRLDIRRFAEEEGRLEAGSPVAQWGRVLGETGGEGRDRPVHWTARGELRNRAHVHPEPWLHLQAEANLPLVCQRCLATVDVPVEVTRSFRFAADEATAAAEDDAAEEDVLAISHSFDLVELVEDELLMALPVAPRHEVCPDEVPMSASDPGFHEAESDRRRPFAVLGQLKTGKQ